VERLENNDYAGQIRSLRLHLGRNFKPISTEALAALVRIKVVSVRGIEAGRRELNDDDRVKIAIYAGAKWDKETRQWICADSERKIPFDRLTHECYIAKLDSGRSMVPGNQASFQAALEFLLNRLSAKEANLALLRLRDLVLQIAKENQDRFDTDAIEYLESTAIVRGVPGETFPVRIEETGEIIQSPIGESAPAPIESVKKTSKKQRPSRQ
jgi:hypothetical protein